MNTVLYAALHFLVDLTCAWAMFAYFGARSGENLLAYNFCAFALQMPLGTLLDLFRDKCRRLPAFCAALGALLTAAGALLHPALLGFGNALFHIGGGVDVIAEDFAKERKGRELGLFVAPGAIGLYFGTILGRSTDRLTVLLLVSLLTAAFLAALFRKGKVCDLPKFEHQSGGVDTLIIAICCFFVVVLRSWIGLAVIFEWKMVPILGCLAVFATAVGKFSGGVLAARFGHGKTASVTLVLAALAYLLADIPVLGLAAMCLFNMSMPLTLYLLIRKLPHLAGFSFGLLTFGLFLGFLPVYFRVSIPMPGNIFGALGSIISCILLIAAGKATKNGTVSA